MWRYYVYLIQCFDGTFYVGVMNNVERRFWEHCNGTDSTSYTFSRRPLRLVTAWDFQWINDAISFEKKIKKWSHRKKRAFAEGKFADVTRYARGRDRER
jgi:putative endonuclease